MRAIEPLFFVERRIPIPFEFPKDTELDEVDCKEVWIKGPVLNNLSHHRPSPFIASFILSALSPHSGVTPLLTGDAE